MSYLTEHKQKFEDLEFQLDNLDALRRESNGGNSILFTYPSEEEKQYIQKAEELYGDKAVFIDVSKLLVSFIDQDGWDDFKIYYQDFKDTPNVIFNMQDEEKDLFGLIIEAIDKASKEGKIPILIRTGVLYGTGIENANIMEHPLVMKLSKPLVIFYPSRLEDDNLYFLNFKLASKYRCTLIK